MKKNALLFFAILFSLSCIAEDIVSHAFGDLAVRHAPTRDEILKDSKPAKLSVVDQIFLKQDEIRMGAARIIILVDRLTGSKVEYVWSYQYRRFLRPRYTIPNAQNLFNQWSR